MKRIYHNNRSVGWHLLSPRGDRVPHFPCGVISISLVLHTLCIHQQDYSLIFDTMYLSTLNPHYFKKGEGVGRLLEK